MNKGKYSVIGVMSGTSLDGIDIVHVQFYLEPQWQFKVLKAETIQYTSYWKQALQALVDLKPEALEVLDKAYTVYLAGIIKGFVQKHKIEHVDAVCSHGHTALHKPEQGITYQIGNREEIATYLDHRVVCNFRVQDVALGGQGAPLVPIGDALLFSNYDFCLNLGGFANISLQEAHTRIAYDVCPVNIVLNHYARLLGLDYDAEGKLASKGQLHEGLLKALNALPFYQELPPKSLGLEWVTAQIFPLLKSFQLEIKDVLRTFCEHVAIQISKTVNVKSKASVLITGGGAYNYFLLERIKAHTTNTIICPNADIIEFKEAIIFGCLGVLKLRDEINCLKSVTGASKDHSSGEIYLPLPDKF